MLCYLLVQIHKYIISKTNIHRELDVTVTVQIACIRAKRQFLWLGPTCPDIINYNTIVHLGERHPEAFEVHTSHK